MSRAFSFVALLAVLAVGAWFYMRQSQTVMSAGSANPTATVDLMGVRNDLLAIAQAERSHAVSKGGYVSLDQLCEEGDLAMQRTNRGLYNYSADVSDTSFRIVATWTGSESAGMPHTISIDQTMEITQQ